jgi:hypothetical protein
MAIEYVVILILVALGAVLVLANYGRNVGNQVDAAGGKIDTLGAGPDVAARASGSGGGAGRSSGAGGGGGSPSASAEAPQGGASARRDAAGAPLPGSAAEASSPPQGTGTSTRQIAIGGIILGTLVLLAVVRFSQNVRRMSEDRQEEARKAAREEANRDLDEDTLTVKRSELLGEQDEGEEDR